ncbi:hypothetical protein D3C78_1642620 [compost metagenome]
MNRHLAALGVVQAVAVALVGHLQEGDAAPDVRALLTVARQHPVGVAQGVGRADGGGFLTGRAEVEAEAALALQGDHALIERAGLDHGAVELEQILAGDVGHPIRVGAAVFIEHGVRCVRHWPDLSDLNIY